MRHASEVACASAIFRLRRGWSGALRPAARDGVVRDAVLPRCGPWPGGVVGSEVTCCRIRCSRWRRCVGASIHSRVRGAWRRARRPRRRAMIRGDSSDVICRSEAICRRILCSRWRRCVGASIRSEVRGAWRRARRPRRRAMIRGDSSDVCVDLRNRHRDHAHSGRRARAVGRLAAYRHNGAGSVQCFNAAGA